MHDKVAILSKSLKYACKASSAPSILKGRQQILDLPRKWVIDNIHKVAEETLDLTDDWEYRRLLELYTELDLVLLRKLIAFGMESPNEAIREAAGEFNSLKFPDNN